MTPGRESLSAREFNLHDRLQRRADLAVLYQDEHYLVVTGDRKLRLNASAFSVWEALGLAGDRNQIIERVAAAAAQPAELVAADVLDCVARFIDCGLIERAAMDAPAGRGRYLMLLKKSLLNLLYAEDEFRLNAAEKMLAAAEPITAAGLKALPRQQQRAFEEQLGCRRTMTYRPEHRLQFAHSMIGESGLRNIEHCAAIVFAEGVDGDFLEAGVCRGGATIFMRALQKAYQQAQRRTFVADSFAGLPPPEHAVDRATGVDWSESQVPPLACALEDVQELFARYGLADEQVIYLKGWFPEPLRDPRIGQLAILRLDCDLYSSTRAVLETLYEKVAPGGFVIVDDYGFLPECRQAVDEFRRKRQIDSPLTWVNSTCVYWRIPRPAGRARPEARCRAWLFGRPVESDLPLWPSLPQAEEASAAQEPTGESSIRLVWAGRINRPSRLPQPLPYTRRRIDAAGCRFEWADRNGDVNQVAIDAAGRTISIGYSGPRQRSFEYLLAGVAGAAALHCQGEALWHASAVLTPRGAVVFAADSGGGKSTLAAACVAQGRPLLGDEMLLLREQDGQLAILSSHPILKLTQQSCATLQAPRSAAVYDWPFETEERWLSALDLAGGYASGVYPVLAVYLLQPRDSQLDTPLFSSQQWSPALREQLRYGRGWLPQSEATQGLAPEAEVPVFQLTLPCKLERIRDCAQSVVKHALAL